jgi:hypothetical protein
MNIVYRLILTVALALVCGACDAQMSSNLAEGQGFASQLMGMASQVQSYQAQQQMMRLQEQHLQRQQQQLGNP